MFLKAKCLKKNNFSFNIKRNIFMKKININVNFNNKSIGRYICAKINENSLNKFVPSFPFSTYRSNNYSSNKELKLSTIFDILKQCRLEPEYQTDNIKSKYCPLCEKPHNDDPTNLNTFILYKTSFIYFCFRCGNKGHFLRLFKILNKKYDLTQFKDVIGKGGGYSSNGNTTENDDYQPEFRRSSHEETSENEKRMNTPTVNNEELRENVITNKSTYSNMNTMKNFNNFDPKENFKISLNNSGLITELYRRNLLLDNPKCSIILDYLLNERKLTAETLKFYKIGVNYERFKSNSYEYINLPCVSYPMFFPTDKNALLAIERGAVEDSLYDYYKCDKFYLSRLKVRAIGKEFKHFQKMEPAGSVLWGLFGLDTVPDNAEEIIITEGEYDAMAAYQELKIPSVSLPNGASNLPTQVLSYFNRFKRIYLWMDADQAGQVASNNFAKKLGEKKVLIINTRKNDPLGPKDSNDALREGKDFTEYLKQAKPLSGDNIIKLSDIKSEIVQFLSQYEHYSGYKATSFSFFNKKLKGLRMGEFSIFTGETGSGKTTFLSQLSLDFVAQHVPTLWGSFEIKNDKLASLFLMQNARKNLRLSPVPEIEFHTENFEKLPLYMLKFHGSQNIDEIINSMNFAVYNYDIQNIVLDNLQFMIGSPSKVYNKFDFQDEIIQRLRKFCTDKNVHLTLVIHPRKDEILKISSIFGTGKASQEADNIYILQSYKGLRILEVAKNRFDGTTGKVALAFDNESCRFFELTVDEFSKVVKNNAKVDEIIKDRYNKYGCLEPPIDQVLNDNNKKIADDTSLLDSFVNQKEKEINQFAKGDSSYFNKEKIIESDTRLFDKEIINNSKNNVNVNKIKIRDIVNNEEIIELSLSCLNEIKNELSINQNKNNDSERINNNKIQLKNNPNTLQVKNENINSDLIIKKTDSLIKIKTEISDRNINLKNSTANLPIDKDIDENIIKTSSISEEIDINQINKPNFTDSENDLKLMNYKLSDIEAFQEIKSFQKQFFPETKVTDTFHDAISHEKTNSNSIGFRRSIGSKDKNDPRVRQSTFKVSRDSIIDDIF